MITSETKLILEKLDKLDSRMTNLEDKVTDVETNLQHQITALEDKVTNLDNKVTNLDNKVTGVEKNLQHQITDIQMTLENVTNKNIILIAEAHQELDRKFNEALKVEEEKEMLLIRVNHLEDDVRKIKQKNSETA